MPQEDASRRQGYRTPLPEAAAHSRLIGHQMVTRNDSGNQSASAARTPNAS